MILFTVRGYAAISCVRYRADEFCALQLVSGFAEIFGTELVKNHPYTFPSGSKVAVFSWQGCTVNISFDCLH